MPDHPPTEGSTADAEADTYLVTCLYGLEEELAGEAAGRLGVEPEHHWCEVLFAYPGDAANLRSLRLANNVWLRMSEFSVGPTRQSLDDIAGRLRALPVQRWLRRLREFRGAEPEPGPICVTVNRKGEHKFTYKDVEERATETVESALGRRAALGEGALDLRIDLDGNRCRLMGRLSEGSLADRDYKIRHTRAETHAALAAAMVRRSEPAADDYFLDPFCGSGTIAVERALLGPAGLIVAGDSKEKYSGWAGLNARKAGVSVGLGAWDARHLPFPDRTFSAVVTSPPHGRPRDGRPWRVEEFAPLLAELVRVLEYGCPLVLLTREEKLVARCVKRIGYTRLTDRLTCEWKGIRHAVCTVRKTP
ncbi:MAG: hypothetical protein ACOC7T_00190 [Planctomycetota bacterium]